MHYSLLLKYLLCRVESIDRLEGNLSRHTECTKQCCRQVTHIRAFVFSLKELREISWRKNITKTNCLSIELVIEKTFREDRVNVVRVSRLNG